MSRWQVGRPEGGLVGILTRWPAGLLACLASLLVAQDVAAYSGVMPATNGAVRFTTSRCLVRPLFGTGQGGGGGPVHNPPASPLFGPETFETATTGYVLPDWDEFNGGAGIIDPAYTGVVLDGTQGLRVVTSGGAGCWIQRNITPRGNIYIYAMFRIVTFPGDKSVIEVQDVASSPLGGVRLVDGGWEVFAGATTAFPVGLPSAGVLYHLWFEYNKNNGANRIANFGFSTTGIRPSSGDNYAQASTTTSATDISIVAFGVPANDFSTDAEFILDYLLADDAQIGNTP